MTATEIIDELLGGTTIVATALGCPLSTVQSWKKWNQIPQWRQPKLLELATTRGAVLSTADFPAPEERVAA